MIKRRPIARRQQPVDDPFLIALTDEERLHGLDLFSIEPSRMDQPESGESTVYERVSAYGESTPASLDGPLEEVARPLPAKVPPAPAAPLVPSAAWNAQIWSAPVLAAVLTAAIVVYAVLTVRVMRPTPDTRMAASTGRTVDPPQDVRRARPVAQPAPPPPMPPAVQAATPRVDSEPIAASEAAPRPAPAPPAPPARSERQASPAVREAAARPAAVEAPAPAPLLHASMALVPDIPTLPDRVPAERPAVAAIVAAPPRVEASVAPAPRPPAPETAIQTVLGQYRTAYRDLDASAARAVWPSVDTKALRKAFDNLERQDLIFDSCRIAVSDARAVASCRGFAWYVPRVGNKNPHDDQREWEFTLSKVDEAWFIDTVSAR